MNSGFHNVFKILALLFAGHFLVDVMLGIWPVYKTMMQLDLAKAGLIAGVGAFLGEGAQLIFGSLSDRGYRGVLIKLGVLLTCTNIFLAYTDSYALFFLFYSLTCLGSGAFHPCGASLTGSLTESRKSFFMTIFISGGAMGMAFSQMIFSQSFQWFGKEIVFIALPSLIIVGLMFLIRGSAFSKEWMPASQKPKKSFFACFRLFKHRLMTKLYFIQLCNQAVMWATIFLLPDILHTRGYENWMAFGGGHFALIMGSALMMVPGGWLADKYSPKIVILSSSLLGSLLFMLFLFSPPFSAPITLVLLFVLGSLIGIINPVVIAFGYKILPNQTGMVSAFLMGMVWCLAEFIGPGGGGFLSTFFSEDAPAKALQFFTVFFVAGTMLAMRLPQTEAAGEEVLVWTNDIIDINEK